jgi:hypothetical protein
MGQSNATLPSVKLEDLTLADSPLKITVQKIKWKDNRIRFWGVVTNTSDQDFAAVSVSFRALDKDHRILGRAKSYVDSQSLLGSERGNISGMSIDTGGRIPAIIQFKASGSVGVN